MDPACEVIQKKKTREKNGGIEVLIKKNKYNICLDSNDVVEAGEEIFP